ncbi:MAG: hypothetical protein BGO01_11860 [Armatimonadetes bacterium 55-13]|nr:S1/P1 nuclease [Armatimonadota bacterium]OJU63486.1 MAG: hypothetical protein BGO01_11860 [Armatimonadetes bacterium 55-13]
MKTSRILLTFVSALAVTSAFAWHDTGHMVVAAIAKQSLTPKALSEAEWLLKMDADPKSDNFVTAACWADDAKTKESGPWHYINIHFRTDDKPTSNEPLKQNIVWAISKFSEVLRDKKRDPKERAEALRYLIHFVGDIHQPLHAVARDSDEHPDGDRGGNEFKISPPERFSRQDRPPTNLHSLWDSGLGLFKSVPRPLTDDGLATINRTANAIKSRFPEISLDGVKQSDPMAWAQESADIAKRFVYKDITEGTVPSPEYMRKGEDECAKRVAYAGYRLAALLNKLLN